MGYWQLTDSDVDIPLSCSDRAHSRSPPKSMCLEALFNLLRFLLRLELRSTRAAAPTVPKITKLRIIAAIAAAWRLAENQAYNQNNILVESSE